MQKEFSEDAIEMITTVEAYDDGDEFVLLHGHEENLIVNKKFIGYI